MTERELVDGFLEWLEKSGFAGLVDELTNPAARRAVVRIYARRYVALHEWKMVRGLRPISTIVRVVAEGREVFDE